MLIVPENQPWFFEWMDDSEKVLYKRPDLPFESIPFLLTWTDGIGKFIEQSQQHLGLLFSDPDFDIFQ